MNPNLVWYVIGSLAVAILATALIVRAIRRRTALPIPDETSRESSPSAPFEALRAASPLEAREAAIRERIGTGLCLYCNEDAAHTAPTLRIVRSPLDALLRYLSVKTLDRWYVATSRGIEIPHSLCAKHHERSRGLLERRLAYAGAEYAKFVDGLRRDLYGFEVVELDAELQEDMAAVRRGRSKKQKATASVVDITTARSAVKLQNGS